MQRIFIQIASYRDPELVPTIRDCITKAKYPNRLRFGICWQRDESESLEELEQNDNIRYVTFPWQQSKGLCWARSLVQKLWRGEEYTLQLDSHHRFLQDWDEHLIEMMKLTGSAKPILTSYAGMYSPEKDGPGKLLNIDPYKMVPDKFTPSGTILFRPHSIEGWQDLKKPIPARFVSGHFYFTLGKHCEEYKYDPNLYFAGDEISLSIRSYTLGYDLFHPHYTVIWHEYTREGRVKHWDDFSTKNVQEKIVEKTWYAMDEESKRRLRHMLQEEDNKIDLGEYGLGRVRSHADYEKYAGINFAQRKLHPDASTGVNPPTNIIDDDWLKAVITAHTIWPEWDSRAILKDAVEFNFWYFGVEDESGKVLYRHDMNAQTYPKIFSGEQSCIKVDFISTTRPHKWVLWPMTKDGKWLTKIEKLL